MPGNDVVYLDASYVGAQPPFGSHPVTGVVQPRPPFPPGLTFNQDHGAQKAYANGTAFFPQANQGQVELALVSVLEGLNGSTVEKIQHQLEFHAKTQRFLIGDSARRGYPPASSITSPYKFLTPNVTEDNYGKVWIDRMTKPMDTASEYDFFGTPIMAVAGVYYWLFGGGQDRNVNIGSLNLSVVPTNFPPIMKAVAANGPGTYQINEPFSMNTFDPFINAWTGFLLGRIGGNVSGTLNIDAAGSYTFVGSFTLNPDRYDADVSNRTKFQESATTFLHMLGDKFGHADYTINVKGSQPLNLSGHK